MSNLFVPVILGTAREGRRSAGVAHHFIDRLKARDILTDLIDVADYPLDGTAGPSSARSIDGYRETVKSANGFVIVAPEYNHGYPGELKLLLDSDHAGYRRKPVGLVGVSAGRIGGARMVTQLQVVMLALGLVPVSPTVLISNVESALDGRGGFAEESLAQVADDMLGEVETLAGALTTAT